LSVYWEFKCTKVPWRPGLLRPLDFGENDEKKRKSETEEKGEEKRQKRDKWKAGVSKLRGNDARLRHRKS